VSISAGVFSLAAWGLFIWLFRGEIVEKSLHYYFLSPIRREVLVVGKFLAGLVTSAVFFGSSVLLSFLITYGHIGAEGRAFMFSRLGMGIFWPMSAPPCWPVSATARFFWRSAWWPKTPCCRYRRVVVEAFHPVFPAMLQRLSITFYLKQLCPVDVLPEGLMRLFTVVAEPVSAWIAVPGLLTLAMAVLSWRASAYARWRSAIWRTRDS